MILFRKKPEKEGKKVAETPKVEEKIELRPEKEKIEKLEKKEVPLFVKLERYEEILSALNKLKLNLQDLLNALSVLQEVERVREANLRMLQESLNKLREGIDYFDSQFTRPISLKLSLREEDLKKVEKRINKLRSSLEKVKIELGVK